MEMHNISQFWANRLLCWLKIKVKKDRSLNNNCRNFPHRARILKISRFSQTIKGLAWIVILKAILIMRQIKFWLAKRRTLKHSIQIKWTIIKGSNLKKCSNNNNNNITTKVYNSNNNHQIHKWFSLVAVTKAFHHNKVNNKVYSVITIQN